MPTPQVLRCFQDSKVAPLAPAGEGLDQNTTFTFIIIINNICFVSSPDLILNNTQLLQGDCDQIIAQTRDRKKEFIAHASLNFIVFALSYVLLMQSVSGGFQDQELFSWLPY